jgi:hypothetical protein
MPANHRATYDALMIEIARQVEKIQSQNINVLAQAETVRDLALAFRYAAGGQQPGGSTVVEKG